MRTSRHPVDLRYDLAELLAMFEVVNREDVEAGGRYDARSGVVNIWSHHWANPATREESETMGTVYVNWVTDSVWLIECDEGFDLDDLLLELGILEQKAIGRVKYGKTRSDIA